MGSSHKNGLLGCPRIRAKAVGKVIHRLPAHNAPEAILGPYRGISAFSVRKKRPHGEGVGPEILSPAGAGVFSA
jgi:hypothetical protein